MRLFTALFFFFAGAVSLWAAFTGQNIYYGRLGVSNDEPGTPMPRHQGRLVATLAGIFFLCLGCVVLWR